MWNRRECLQTAVAGLGLAWLGGEASWAVEANADPSSPVFCFNTSCIRQQKLPLTEIIGLISKSRFETYRYTGIEPWLNEIETYLQGGGTLPELKRQLDDGGLKLKSLIAFANWGSDNEADRVKALEDARQTLSMVAQLGGTHIAAPPAGISKAEHRRVELDALAERYGKLLEVGQHEGVTPMLEVWGHSSNLSKLSEVLYVASACGQPSPLLLDVYHLYKGGSDLQGLKLISGNMMPAFHLNDLPLTKSRAEWSDSDRVYPGDGEADVTGILHTIYANGFRGALSLELFNRDYWKQAPDQVIATGLEKMVTSYQDSIVD